MHDASTLKGFQPASFNFQLHYSSKTPSNRQLSPPISAFFRASPSPLSVQRLASPTTHLPGAFAARCGRKLSLHHPPLFAMPSILSEDDKQTVKRTVPKPSNRIIAVAVARLYIAYPNPSEWTYTGLQGAAVLANDLVGNTFWIKLVDISVSWSGTLQVFRAHTI
jgi:hypothetical protein